MRYKNKYKLLKPATIAAFKMSKYHHGTVTVPSCKIDLETPILIS